MKKKQETFLLVILFLVITLSSCELITSLSIIPSDLNSSETSGDIKFALGESYNDFNNDNSMLYDKFQIKFLRSKENEYIFVFSNQTKKVAVFDAKTLDFVDVFSSGSDNDFLFFLQPGPIAAGEKDNDWISGLNWYNPDFKELSIPQINNIVHIHSHYEQYSFIFNRTLPVDASLTSIRSFGIMQGSHNVFATLAEDAAALRLTFNSFTETHGVANPESPFINRSGIAGDYNYFVGYYDVSSSIDSGNLMLYHWQNPNKSDCVVPFIVAELDDNSFHYTTIDGLQQYFHHSPIRVSATFSTDYYPNPMSKSLYELPPPVFYTEKGLITHSISGNTITFILNDISIPASTYVLTPQSETMTGTTKTVYAFNDNGDYYYYINPATLKLYKKETPW